MRPGCNGARTLVRAGVWALLAVCIFRGGPAPAQRPRVMVALDVATTEPDRANRALMRALRTAGITAETVAADALTAASTLEHNPLLILTRADRLPAAAAPQIAAFLRRGGRLVALRAPAWQNPRVFWQGQWLSTTGYARVTAPLPPQRSLFDFSMEDLQQWQRSTNTPEAPASQEVVPARFGEGPSALQVSVSHLTGWDLIGSPVLSQPFPQGHTLTIFAAKGGPRTTALAVEWEERDGSRWIAVVPLSTEWRRYVLPPSAFRYWQSRPDRGGPGDRFRPENAARIRFGLAFTHTGTLGGAHRYWITNVGTSSPEAEPAEDPMAVAMPPMDGLFPEYKFYPITTPTALSLAADAPVAPAGSLPRATRILAPHPRPRGVGLGRERQWRWVPLINAVAGNAQWRGHPAALLLWTDGPYRGAMVATCGVQDPDFYAHPVVARFLAQLVARMEQAIFFHEGGASAFTCFREDTLALGARVVNFAHNAARCAVRLRLVHPGTEQEVLRRDWNLEVPADSALERRLSVPARALWSKRDTAAPLRVRCELLQNGRVIDTLAHDIHLWTPPARPSFVRVARGEFWLDGKLWRPHGVNYMPSSGIGTEDNDYFEHWIGRRPYDPQVIERDLQRVRAMGFNAVSAFIYYQSLPARNLPDFLRLCRKYNLRVNLSLRPGTPMDFRWEEMKAIIQTFRLRQNDTVFAYDLAWEPHFGSHVARRQWDRDWERWIEDRYGTVRNAERDWEFPVPVEQERVTNPPDHQLMTDGPWRAMVAAYRHFLDNLLYRKYHAAAQKVRSVDPHHLISFRMWEAGNPTYNHAAMLPYDFPGLAIAMDFLAPEAYGRIGDWKQVRPGIFVVAYARAFAPNKPVLWAEMGLQVLPPAQRTPDPDLLQRQATFYRDFYRMLRLSRSNGVFFWWYPGGYRVNENSDYGIINPDGTDRPVTRVIRQEGPRFLAMPPAEPPDIWFTMDRDATPDGVHGIYRRLQRDFWNAFAAGKRPGLRTGAAGRDSRNVSLIAVGNRPFHGQNPPRLLDAVFDHVTLIVPGEPPRSVSDSATVSVGARTTLTLTVTLRNTSPTLWKGLRESCRDSNVAPRLPSGYAALQARIGDRVYTVPVLGDVPPGARATLTFRVKAPPAGPPEWLLLRPVIHNRAFFGDAFRLRIEAQ